MPYEEYYDLKGGAEEFKYVLSQFTHLTDTDEQSYSPQYVDYILSSVVDTKSIIDSCTFATPYAICNHCVNHNTKGKSKACQQREDEDDIWLLNSGASAHFTNNFDAFIKYHQYAKLRHSQMANSLAPILDEGTILIWFNGNVM